MKNIFKVLGLRRTIALCGMILIIFVAVATDMPVEAVKSAVCDGGLGEKENTRQGDEHWKNH